MTVFREGGRQGVWASGAVAGSGDGDVGQHVLQLPDVTGPGVRGHRLPRQRRSAAGRRRDVLPRPAGAQPTAGEPSSARQLGRRTEAAVAGARGSSSPAIAARKPRGGGLTDYPRSRDRDRRHAAQRIAAIGGAGPARLPRRLAGRRARRAVRPKPFGLQVIAARAGRSTVENAGGPAAAGLAVGHADGRAGAFDAWLDQPPHHRLRQPWPLAQAALQRHRFRAAASGGRRRRRMAAAPVRPQGPSRLCASDSTPGCRAGGSGPVWRPRARPPCGPRRALAAAASAHSSETDLNRFPPWSRTPQAEEDSPDEDQIGDADRGSPAGPAAWRP